MKAFEDAVYERQEAVAQAYGVDASDIVDIIRQGAQADKLPDELATIVSITNGRQIIYQSA